MRKIKFRAWDKDEKQMYDVAMIDLLNKEVVLEIPEVPEMARVHFNDVILLQYTGLQDKNGKEIYEGDIVKVFPLENEERGKIEVGVILWNDGKEGRLNPNGFYVYLLRSAWYLKETNNDYTNPESYGKIIPIPCCNKFIEIIGNIYENPELLKEG